jgi:drug/metabolite transporter (DMT)-like permease
MNVPLSATQIAVLCAYALGMAGGQMLFKTASLRIAADMPLAERAVSLLQNWWFLAALAIYLALSLLWVWILSFTPISRAYPFVALAFAITPLLGAVLFSEPISVRMIVGLAVILGGLVLVAGG